LKHSLTVHLTRTGLGAQKSRKGSDH